MDLFQQQREARNAAFLADLARQRGEFRAARETSPSRLALAAAEVHVDARPVSEPAKPVGAMLPPQLRAVARGHTPAPNIQLADVKPLRPCDRPKGAAWFKAVALAVARRADGDPMATTIAEVAGRMRRLLESQGTGWVTATLKNLATMARARGAGAISTITEVVRWLERHGLLDTWHTKVRDRTGRIVNGPNAYLLRNPEDHPFTEEEAASPLKRAKLRIQRWAATCGLEAREWSLNVTAALDPRRALRET